MAPWPAPPHPAAVPYEDEPGLPGLATALRWHLGRKINSPRPGPHRGRQAGAEGLLHDLVPLIRHPDPRRLDIGRSITDPTGMAQVRRFAQPARVTVHIVLDLSASISAVGHSDRHRIAALLAGAIAAAALPSGDGWALWLAQGAGVTELHAASRRQVDAAALAAEVSAIPAQGSGPEGLIALAGTLPRLRTLTILISDFEVAPPELDQVMTAFAGHELIPLWLRDSGFEAPPPLAGRLPRLWRQRDPETGRARTGLLTAAIARRAAAEAAEARAQLRAVFARHDRRPVEVQDRIDAAHLAAELAGLA